MIELAEFKCVYLGVVYAIIDPESGPPLERYGHVGFYPHIKALFDLGTPGILPKI
jgi:hypothetical protein